MERKKKKHLPSRCPVWTHQQCVGGGAQAPGAHLTLGEIRPLCHHRVCTPPGGALGVHTCWLLGTESGPSALVVGTLTVGGGSTGGGGGAGVGDGRSEEGGGPGGGRGRKGRDNDSWMDTPALHSLVSLSSFDV